jgi:hypothetical protein
VGHVIGDLGDCDDEDADGLCLDGVAGTFRALARLLERVYMKGSTGCPATSRTR